MIKIINTIAEFNKLLEFRNRMIFENTVVPSRIFKHDYKLFRFFEEGLTLQPKFLDPIIGLSKHLGIEEIMYMMIEPDPSEYYLNFYRYGTFIFSSDSPVNSVWKFFFDEPAGDLAGLFACIVDKSVFIPICEGTPDWCVYRDRTNCEVGIIAFKNKEIMDIFLRLDKEDIITDANNSLKMISVAWHGKMPQDFKDEFLKNYG